MNFIIENFDSNNIYFQSPVKNTVIDNSIFIGIIYSTDSVSLNSISMNVNFNVKQIEQVYNKVKLYISNDDEIKRLCKIENEILNRADIYGKTRRYHLSNQLNSGFIKIIHQTYPDNINIILKISGIWETQTDYGLTYKFVNALTVSRHVFHNYLRRTNAKQVDY